MTKDQKAEYEYSLKRLADEYAVKETSREEGLEEGRKEGESIGRAKEKIEIIKKLLNMDTSPVSQIAQVTSVDEAYVLSIKSQMDNNGK